MIGLVFSMIRARPGQAVAAFVLAMLAMAAAVSAPVYITTADRAVVASEVEAAPIDELVVQARRETKAGDRAFEDLAPKVFLLPRLLDRLQRRDQHLRDHLRGGRRAGRAAVRVSRRHLRARPVRRGPLLHQRERDHPQQADVRPAQGQGRRPAGRRLGHVRRRGPGMDRRRQTHGHVGRRRIRADRRDRAVLGGLRLLRRPAERPGGHRADLRRPAHAGVDRPPHRAAGPGRGHRPRRDHRRQPRRRQRRGQERRRAARRPVRIADGQGGPATPVAAASTGTAAWSPRSCRSARCRSCCCAGSCCSSSSPRQPANAGRSSA